MKTIRILTAVIVLGLPLLTVGLTGCNQKPVERTDTEKQIDQKITENVQAAFGNSPAFKYPDVRVATFKGKVQLSGFVVSDDQKSSAETIAKAVPSVVEVENEISLKH